MQTARFRILAACLATVVLVAAACATEPIDADDDDDIASVSGTPPSFTSFQSDVQPFMDAKVCGSASCHAAPGSGTFALITPAATATTSDAFSNFTESICSRRFVGGSAPGGKMVTYFCDDASTPHAGGHYGVSISAAECAALYGWASGGVSQESTACQ